MLIPNQDYRPDPKRCLQVQGSVNQILIDRLAPQAIALQAASRDPITVYIDSPGGAAELGAALLRILSASDADAAPPCRIITVGTVMAASAAADLLSSGDYAVAYPGCIVYYHGTRTQSASQLTAEGALSLTQYLKVRNDQYAMNLAKKSIGRFIFRFAMMRSQIDSYRATLPKAKDDIECFMDLLRSRVSPAAVSVLVSARIKDLQYRLLLAHVFKSKANQKRLAAQKRIADFEAVLLKSVIDFEMLQNKADSWLLRDSLAKVNDDFLLLRESMVRYSDPQLINLCERWGEYFLSDQEKAAIAALATDQEKENERIGRLMPIFQPLWFYFIALCQTLQEGENNLTASDAFWLGLIDEVVGDPSLPSYRIAIEFKQSALPDSIESTDYPARRKKKRKG